MPRLESFAGSTSILSLAIVFVSETTPTFWGTYKNVYF